MEDIPLVPGGVFVLAPDCVVVEDADEEVMELYMERTYASQEGGLGYLDGKEPELTMELELVPPELENSVAPLPAPGAAKAGRKTRRKDAKAAQAITVELTVLQDPGALRARSGDTGSVLWRSSLHLARRLLSLHHFPPPTPGLFTPSALSQAHVLELGAGTGVLAALLGPLAAKWTATDLEANIKLVQRNLVANGIPSSASSSPVASPHPHESKRLGKHKPSSPGSASGVPAVNVVAEALDWMDVSAQRAAARRRTRGDPLAFALPGAGELDVVVAVDCIYNEHLISPLVDTLACACARGAVALVVMELRSSDVSTQFLSTWLGDEAGFTVVRLGEAALGQWVGAKGRWAGWIGWIPGSKKSSEEY